MRTQTVAGIVCGIVMAGLGAPGQAAESPAYGRWDLKIADGSRPAWLGIQEKDGKDVASFLWGGGSPRDAEAVKVEGNTVSFRANGYEWTAKAEGDVLKGAGVKGDEKLPFEGKRLEPALDVSGEWKGPRNATLKLQQQGSTVTGEVGGRRSQPISEGNVENGVLTFKAGRATYKLTVKGDVLEGTMTRGAGGNAGQERAYTAERQREWGEPAELVNGKDMSGWKVIGDEKNSKWKVVDGILTNTDRGANIQTEKKFRDFKLHVEFRVPEHSNSGVYLRGRHEIQVEDSFGKEPYPGMCGALYGRILPSVNASKKAGEWQTFDVKLIGMHVTIVHNGQTIIDNKEIDGITGGALDNDENAPGPFYLQGDHGPVEYRKITVWPAK